MDMFEDNFNKIIYSNNDVRNIILELSEQLNKGQHIQSNEYPYGISVISNSTDIKTHRKIYFKLSHLLKFINIYSNAVMIQDSFINNQNQTPFLHYGMITNSSCGFYFDIDFKLSNNEENINDKICKIGIIYVKEYIQHLLELTKVKSKEDVNVYVYTRSTNIDNKNGLHIYVPEIHCSKENKRKAYHLFINNISDKLKKMIDEIKDNLDHVNYKEIFDSQPFYTINLLPFSTKNSSSPIYDFSGNYILNLENFSYKLGSTEMSMKNTLIFTKPILEIDPLIITEKEKIDDSIKYLYDNILNKTELEYEKFKYLNMILDKFPDDIFGEFAFKNLFISVLKNLSSGFSEYENIISVFLNKFLARSSKNIEKHKDEWELYLIERQKKVPLNYNLGISNLILYGKKNYPDEFENNIISDISKNTFLKSLLDENEIMSPLIIFNILTYFISDKLEIIKEEKNLSIYKLSMKEYKEKKNKMEPIPYNRWILDDSYCDKLNSYLRININKEINSFINSIKFNIGRINTKISVLKKNNEDTKEEEEELKIIKSYEKKLISKVRSLYFDITIRNGIKLFLDDIVEKSKIKNNKDKKRKYIGFLNGVVKYNKNTKKIDFLELYKKHYVTRTANCEFIRIPKNKNERYEWSLLCNKNKLLAEAYDYIYARLQEIINPNGEYNKTMYEKDTNPNKVNIFEYVMMFNSNIYSEFIAEICMIFNGQGGDGKTCQFNLHEGTFGQTEKNGYVGICAANAFTKKQGDSSSHQEFLSHIKDARVTYLQDPSKKDGCFAINDGLAKQILSNSTVPVRGIFQKQEIVRFQTDMVFFTNYQLNVGRCDQGIERRFIQVNMTNSFTTSGKSDNTVLKRFTNDKYCHIAYASILADFYEEMMERFGKFSNIPTPLGVKETTTQLFESGDIGYGFMRRYIRKNKDDMINLTILEDRISKYKNSKNFDDARSIQMIINDLKEALYHHYNTSIDGNNIIGVELIE